MAEVTVVICTYQRPALLALCLDSLTQQTIRADEFLIIVVDNHGCDDTRKVAANYGARYLLEPTVGLSNARNAGARAATTPWVFYLDDDGIAFPDMLEQFSGAVRGAAVKVIGGKYEHYFARAPKRWVKYYYQDPVRASKLSGTVALCQKQYLSGGIMAARKEVIVEHPFDPNLGMEGLIPGFGEENEWQDRLRRSGITIFYNDAIGMRHLVQFSKQTIRKRIGLAYAHGRYHFLTTKAKEARQPGSIGFSLNYLGTFIRAFPYDLMRVLFKPGFYWQNGMVSTLGKLAFIKGKYGR